MKDRDLDVSPGQYDDGIRFNSNTKSFRIGEKHEERIERTAGPGEYRPERADGITKQKIPNVNLGTSPARPGMAIKDKDFEVAPGQYNHEQAFGSDAKSFRIGEKREGRIDKTAGPGEYSPERADVLTKQKTPNINLGSTPARPVGFAGVERDLDVAPG